MKNSSVLFSVYPPNQTRELGQHEEMHLWYVVWIVSYVLICAHASTDAIHLGKIRSITHNLLLIEEEK